jgi:hypothetical protein
MVGCVTGQCGGGGTILSERVLTHTMISPDHSAPHTDANESFMDELAFHAKDDPIDFRLRYLRDFRDIGVLRLRHAPQTGRVVFPPVCTPVSTALSGGAEFAAAHTRETTLRAGRRG